MLHAVAAKAIMTGFPHYMKPFSSRGHFENNASVIFFAAPSQHANVNERVTRNVHPW